MGVGLHAIDIGDADEAVVLCRRRPHQVGGLVKLPVLQGDASWYGHRPEDVVFGVFIGNTVVLVSATVSHPLAHHHAQVSPLGVACLLGNRDVGHFLLVLVAFDGVGLDHRTAVLLEVGDVHIVGAETLTRITQLGGYVVGESGNLELDVVRSVTLRCIFAAVDIRQSQ